MKLSFNALTAALCISLAAAAQEVRKDCLDEKRYNLETVCRATCEKEAAVAFSVSYDDTDDTCRCHGNIDGLGAYIGGAGAYIGGAGEEDHTQVTCYSIANSGRCCCCCGFLLGWKLAFVDSSFPLPATILLPLLL